MTESIITVVGSLNMDLVARSPHIPQPGETIIGGELYTLPGGKGANQAVAAARLGAATAMVGRVGQDAFAAPLLENLAAANIDYTFVQQDAANATGAALIVVDDAGENSIVVTPGANHQLSPADVVAAEAVIAGAKVLLLQLEIPLESVIKAAQLAQARGVTVILNPAPAQALPPELLHAVDILVPNETETEILTEMPVNNQTEAEAAAANLRDQGVATVILTLGSRGALLVDGNQRALIPPFSITPVDTTAAGDAFAGGLAVALAEGRALPEAVRWGNAAGALAATKLGAQP
ncbi:MAG TPA: ribokinase, partial [Chloroflexi bacterium]|nr:ribokinase [Chloroflexota bacterium]